MTEAEWMTQNDLVSMMSIFDTQPPYRKARLLSCAFARSIWELITDPLDREVVEISERYADGEASSADISRMVLRAPHVRGWRWSAHSTVYWACQELNPGMQLMGYGTMREAVAEYARETGIVLVPDQDYLTAALLRDLRGNPFRPVTFLREWRTSTVIALAEKMYETRDFTAMPILADALMDAGCFDEAILSHCRGPGPHVRGCHVVDACLGKS